MGKRGAVPGSGSRPGQGSRRAEPVFEEARAALRFALNFRADHYARPVMSRRAAPTVGCSKGLAGLDGAAQAGLIRCALASLGGAVEAVLVARMAASRVACLCGAACCTGSQPNLEWEGAVSWLARYVGAAVLVGTRAPASVQRACVARYFSRHDEQAGLEEMARFYGVSRQTASVYVRRVAAALELLECDAWDRVEACLLEKGVIG